MKKWLSASLVLTLLACTPLAAVHAEKPVKEAQKGNGGGQGDKDDKGKGKDKGKPDKDKKNGKEKEKPDKDKPTGSTAEGGSPQAKPGREAPSQTESPASQTPSTESRADGTAPSSKNEAIQQAVKTKKELIELRQQLKHVKEATEELKAKYEELTRMLEQQSELKQALDVQKELLNRFYKPGDQKLFDKLGELYEKTGDTSLKTFVNGKEVVMDTAPFVEKGRALVPVRAIGAALKAEVKWNGETRTVEVVRGDNKITLYLDSGEAEVNGEKIKLETPPVIKKGRLFLPLRFIGETLKTKVGYQQKGDLIIIEDGSLTGTDDIDTTPETPATSGEGEEAAPTPAADASEASNTSESAASETAPTGEASESAGSDTQTVTTP
ncbi:copper amine oxidase N-terminal domain-containing protein [Brevibacillus thermoruber]|uniref:copper amine oxidase N-terminal domain-containing protein n=1 Tax=Brevibacillus thermoruber TaxID=33942 RepID=UPI000424D0FB|nr:copper amine oxidase N-terminal domain-containing protein [Brevibacillus thermoruber]